MRSGLLTEWEMFSLERRKWGKYTSSSQHHGGRLPSVIQKGPGMDWFPHGTGSILTPRGYSPCYRQMAANISASLWLWPVCSGMSSPHPRNRPVKRHAHSHLQSVSHSGSPAWTSSIPPPTQIWTIFQDPEKKSHTLWEAFLDNSSHHQSLTMPLAPY